MKLLVFVVFESWSVFFLKLCLAFENCSEAEKRRKEAKESLIYKGKNLFYPCTTEEMITTDSAGFLVGAYSQKKNVLKPAGLHKGVQLKAEN